MKHAAFGHSRLFLAVSASIALVCIGTRIARAATEHKADASVVETKARRDCSEAGEQEMVACVAAEYEAADLELNKLYKQIKERLSPEKHRTLIVAQRAWIKRRDARCASEMGPSDGGADTQVGTSSLLYSGQVNNCLARFTLARTEDLKAKFPASAEFSSVNKPQFEIELLESLVSDSYQPAVGINNAGQIAGNIAPKDGQKASHAIIWKDGSLTDISLTPLGLEFCSFSINRAGNLAGGLYAGASQHAAVWRNSSVTDLDSDESRRRYTSRATGINTGGQVVGWSFTAGSDPTATLWDKGTVVDLGASIKGEGYSEAHAINDDGSIVGRFDELARTKTGRKILGIHAMVWRGTTTKLLPTIGGRNSSAAGINDRGQIVGWSNIKASTGYALISAAHAALWDGNGAIDLGGLSGFTRTTAVAINNVGQIVGSADNPPVGPIGSLDTGDHHALYWGAKRRMIDLNQYLPSRLSEAGWVLIEANGINDAGVIVGSAYNAQTGLGTLFVLKPAKP